MALKRVTRLKLEKLDGWCVVHLDPSKACSENKVNYIELKRKISSWCTRNLDYDVYHKTLGNVMGDLFFLKNRDDAFNFVMVWK